MYKNNNETFIKKLTKMKFVLLASFVASATIPTISAISINAEKQYYLFDNRVFDSVESLLRYAPEGGEINRYDFQTNKYIYDGQTFNTYDEISDYLLNKFEIKTIKTHNNPKDYVVNSMGELSDLVLTNSDQKPVVVYKGQNGQAYSSKQQALNTYKNNYNVTYDVDGTIAYSFAEARELYQSYKLQELEEMAENEKQVLYTQGGIAQSEKQIKQWLVKNMKSGFEYNGEIFSDYNLKEFQEKMQDDINEKMFDQHVKKIINGDKKTYWLNFGDDEQSFNSQSFFVGSRYVETSSDLFGKNTFVQKASTPMNLLSGNIAMTAFSDVFGSMVKQVTFDWSYDESFEEIKESRIYFFIEQLSTDDIISSTTKKQFLDVINDLSPRSVVDSTFGLDEIDTHLDDFSKMLIAMKRMLVAHKLSAHNTVSYEEVENVFKAVILDYTNSNEKMSEIWFDGKDASEVYSQLTFDDIYDIFINQSNFMESNSDRMNFINGVIGFQNGINKIMDMVSETASIADSIKGLEKAKDDYEVQEKVTDLLSKTYSSSQKAIETIAVGLGIAVKGMEFLKPLTLGLKWVSAGWTIYKSLSYIDIREMEYKIDDSQSVYYITPVYKIPLFGVELTSDQPKGFSVNLLTDSALNYLVPEDEQSGNTVIYEFNNKYYRSKEDAKIALIDQIYLHPEKYLISKQILINVMDKQNGYNLPDYLRDAIISNDDEENTITQEEYDRLFEEEKNEFANSLFKQYYEPNKVVYHYDGFGEHFETKQQAVTSMKEKMSDESNYTKKYEYTSLNYKKFYFDTIEDMNNFIDENEILYFKTILNTSLITTSFYDHLEECLTKTTSIYEVNLFGENKYFYSQFLAENYIFTSSNYQKISNIQESITQYIYNDQKFNSKYEFDQWVLKHTKKISNFQLKGREVIHDN